MYDIVIENGKVIDGAGNPWISSNIAIKGDRIEEVSRRKLEAEITISADGLVVTPGLIDSHTHSDNTVLENNIGKNYLFQGVTTVVTGECGNSLYPLTPEYQKIIESKLRSRASDPESIEVDWLTLEDWRDKLEKRGLGVNHTPLIGHKTVRNQILDRDRSNSLTMPTQKEIESEKRIIEQAMEDGSFGLSLNLSSNNIFPEECIQVLDAVKKYGGVFHNHMRSLFYTLRDAVRESIMISENSGVPCICSHVYGRKYEGWGKSIESMRQIQEARDQGVDIVADVYPWPFAACANALALFVSGGSYDERVHGRLEEGLSVKKMVQDLRESSSWQGMKKELLTSWEAENEENEKRRKRLREKSKINAPRTRPIATTPVIAYSKTHPELVGKNFVEVADALDLDDWVTALRQVILDDEGFTYLGTTMSREEDRKIVMSQPWTMFESDSGMIDECPPSPMLKPVHPRGSSCTAMILGHYVRERSLLRLEEAVRKMTSLTAQWHGIMDRGLIREGMKADITIFNPEKIKHNATYDAPCNFASGINTVIVNGKITIEQGEYTGTLAGRVLRLN